MYEKPKKKFGGLFSETGAFSLVFIDCVNPTKEVKSKHGIRKSKYMTEVEVRI